jgi:hypothetical protein
MTNINKLVWNYIDNRIELKKTLLEGLLNISALARVIAKEEKLDKNIDAIISAIRRYQGKIEKKKENLQFYSLLKKAKISTKTKLVSLLIKRNDHTESKISTIYNQINLERDSTLRIFEVTKYIKIIIDQELLKEIKAIFSSNDIENITNNLGEITINYNEDITKIPRVFATLSNELAMNELSIIDSVICHWEHIIVVNEEDLKKAFTVVFGLTRNKV